MYTYDIKYIELKTGYSDNGPAWVGKVQINKSGNTIYFNNKAFRKRRDIYSNYYDVETGEEYWISGVKKRGDDRHWAGGGKIMIDRKIIPEYLRVVGKDRLDMSRFVVTELEDIFPAERIAVLENQRGDRQ